MRLTAGVAVLGCGTVGATVADRLVRDYDALERRSGVAYELRGIAIGDPRKARPGSLDRGMFTHDARALVEDPHVDVIVELIGETPVATELVERALDRGRHVVTANKALLGTQGPRLAALAALRGATLRFEAAAGGAIPLLRSLDEGLAGDYVTAVAGVVNGTTTAMLAAMEAGAEFSDALAAAQRLGYAEADPSTDLNGTDAAHKIALIAQVAFGVAVISPRIRRAGITTVTRRDVARAAELGMRIRLIGALRRTSGGLCAEVAPLLVPCDHDFAQTTGAENVVHAYARDAGRIVLRGAGAGGAATASAVLGDIVTVLRGLSGRRDASMRGRRACLEPAIEVSPLFDATRHAAELPHHPIWDDALVEHRTGAAAAA